MFNDDKTNHLAPLVARSTCQLFAVKPGTTEFLVANACAVLLKWKSKYYCVSNAHVFADNNIMNNFFRAGPGQYATMGGEITSTHLPPTGRREDDLYDIAIVRLTDETVRALKQSGYIFIDKNLIRRNHSVSEYDSLLFTGYPASQTKVNPVRKEIKPQLFSYITHPVTKEMKGTFFTSEHHIIARYARKNLFHPEHGDKIGPSPRGMSGSGIWLIKETINGLAPYLIGIFSTYDENKSIMIGSKIDLFMGIIDS